MLVAQSRGFFRARFEIEEAASHFFVGTLHTGALFNRSYSFICVGKTYEVQVSGMFTTSWTLHHEGAVLAQARSAGFLRRRVEGTCGGKTFVLRPKGWTMNVFEYSEADILLGSIRRRGFFRWSIEIDLLETVPAWAQIYLAAICRTLWVQQASQSS